MKEGRSETRKALDVTVSDGRERTTDGKALQPWGGGMAKVRAETEAGQTTQPSSAESTVGMTGHCGGMAGLRRDGESTEGEEGEALEGQREHKATAAGGKERVCAFPPVAVLRGGEDWDREGAEQPK